MWYQILNYLSDSCAWMLANQYVVITKDYHTKIWQIIAKCIPTIPWMNKHWPKLTFSALSSWMVLSFHWLHAISMLMVFFFCSPCIRSRMKDTVHIFNPATSQPNRKYAVMLYPFSKRDNLAIFINLRWDWPSPFEIHTPLVEELLQVLITKRVISKKLTCLAIPSERTSLDFNENQPKEGTKIFYFLNFVGWYLNHYQIVVCIPK